MSETETETAPVVEPVQKESVKEELKQTRTYSEFFIESFFRSLFFWEHDEKRLGSLIRFLHHSFMFLFYILFVLTHTIVPYISYLCALWIMSVLIWIQHLLCGGCVVNRIERRFLQDTKSFVDPLLELFHIPIQDETTNGITIMGSTVAVLFLTLEITGRAVRTLLTWFHS